MWRRWGDRPPPFPHGLPQPPTCPFFPSIPQMCDPEPHNNHCPPARHPIRPLGLRPGALMWRRPQGRHQTPPHCLRVATPTTILLLSYFIKGGLRIFLIFGFWIFGFCSRSDSPGDPPQNAPIDLLSVQQNGRPGDYLLSHFYRCNMPFLFRKWGI